MAGSPANAESARVKGALVWLDMDQKELDDAYDQSVYAPNQQLLAKRRAAASAAALERLGPPERVAYGPSEHEKLDIYRTHKANAPVNVYVHGGAWRNGQAKDFAAPAEMFVNAGANFVVLDFVQIQEAGGNLLPMAQQVRSAAAWVYKNAASFGADPKRVYITGHSSGAHLSGCTLVTDWEKEFGVPANILKGGLLISGMYDLKPVRLSKRSEYVKFTDEVEEKLSSIRHLDKLHAPITLCYGTEETPEFQRQSREFAAALQAAGKPVELLVGESLNHFEMQETLGNPYAIGGRAALKMLGLTTKIN
jgi:arylformamidase